MSVPIDSLADTAVRSQFLLLGEVTPVLGAVSVFLQEEPLLVTTIKVNIAAEASAVQSFLVYDDDRRFLGTANLDSSASTNRTYTLSLSRTPFQIGQREQRSFYVRARLSVRDSGGQGNQTVQISTIVVLGNGEWSSHAYSKTSSDVAFPVFVTSRSTILSIANAGPVSAGLMAGPNRTLGSFTFIGRRSDATAHMDVTDLTFALSTTGGVSLQSVMLGADGTTDRVPCLVNASTITCSDIPDTFGSLSDGPRMITLYGTVTTVADVVHGSYRLSLMEAGTSSMAGSVTWFDGTTTFTWVALSGVMPDGTYYSY